MQPQSSAPKKSIQFNAPSSSMINSPSSIGILLISFLLTLTSTQSIRPLTTTTTTTSLPSASQFTEAPEYLNNHQCPPPPATTSPSVCDPNAVHISMTLDSEYLRGSIAAIHSILKHASCPENIVFHLIINDNNRNKEYLQKTIESTFPSLRFTVYSFRQELVNKIISSSIRPALDNPLNYARSYLAQMLHPCVQRVIYLDSDVIVVDDIRKLWEVELADSRVIGAPVYCKANFSTYFTAAFWKDSELSKVFEGKSPCYFNTGVMLMDLNKWRAGEYTKRIEQWMRVQKEMRIYELGSLPPFLLVFGGEVEGIEHRWNQHGLGGDNLKGKCRSLHPGPLSLLHWSGKGKPWVRLDERKACLVDYIWAPYDLYQRKASRGGIGTI